MNTNFPCGHKKDIRMDFVRIVKIHCICIQCYIHTYIDAYIPTLYNTKNSICICVYVYAYVYVFTKFICKIFQHFTRIQDLHFHTNISFFFFFVLRKKGEKKNKKWKIAEKKNRLHG